ncbi:MAG: hypothetical protein ACLFO1_03475 [Spirochaetaceae bacterium]
MIDSALFKLPEWFTREGPDNDVVISSRVRLARNIDGLPFVASMNAHARAKVEKEVKTVVDRLKERFTRIDLHRLSDEQLRMLVESNTLGPSEEKRGDVLFLGADRELRVHVNAVDHLRLVGMAPGLDLARIRDRVSTLEAVFDDSLAFAVSLRMGYFTADMRDVGTGMRATALLHLPALAETEGLSEAFRAIDTEDVKYELFAASARVSLGDMVLLANGRAMGRDEVELVEKLEGAISQLVHYEREARESLLATRGEEIRRAVDDAVGYVKYTGAIGGEEAIQLVSRLRLAAIAGMIERPAVPDITSLFFLSQPSLMAYGRDGNRRGAKGHTVNERRALLLKQQLESLR